MSKESTRIWRTVVFSGAMLGAPLVVADTPKPAPPQQAKQKPPPPTPLEVAQSELDAATKRVAEAIDAVATAKSDADRKAASARLEVARKDKAAAEAKVASLKKPPPKPNYADPAAVTKLEKLVQEVDTKVSAAVDAIATAQNDADRKAATAKLTSLRKERDDLNAKLAAEKARPVPRPRTPDSDKPVGRGFILS